MKFLIIGLGNIGSEYEHTRHNIGFDILDEFAKNHDAIFTSGRLADVATLKFKGKQIICIKPTTYMNLSGKAFSYWMQKEHISVENTLTLVDDLAFPIEVLKLRNSGSAAGHNGLKSIEEALGNNNYPRLRFGIGNNFSKGKQVDFVLGKWNEDEKLIIEKKINLAIEFIENFIVMGCQRTMNLLNDKKIEL